MQITFENSQFEQGIELKKLGVAIPDNVLIKHSNLADKNEILDQMENTNPSPPNPLDVAKTALLQAQAALASATADNKQASTAEVRVTSQFGATQAAQAIAATPAIAPLADQLLKSAGFVDQDAPPIIPVPAAPTQVAPAGVPPPLLPALGKPASGGIPMRHNTSPAFPAKIAQPASPLVGADKGIEGAGKP
jgi:hypothetical protein